MSLLTLYLITILPNLHTAMMVGFFLPVIVVTFISLLVLMDSGGMESFDHKASIKWRNALIPVFIIFGLFATLIPNEKQIYMIAGGYAVTNVEGINKLPANIVGAANAYLEKVNKELQPEK